MRKYLFPIVFFSLFILPHLAKADVYFSQPNSNGYDFFDYSIFGHQGHGFAGDDGSVVLFPPGNPEFIGNFGALAGYPISTTSVTSYVTDIILQIRDTDQNENRNYSVQFDCRGLDDETYHGTYYSDFVNSSVFSNGFVAVDFKFSTPNCDLNQYHIHQFVWYLGNNQNTGQTPIQFRTQNVNSVNGYGESNNNGNIFEDYESQMTVLAGIPSTTPVSKIPVLIIPGVLGTDIKKADELLWPNIGQMATDVGDEFMDPLQFNINLEPTDSNLNLGEMVRKPSILFDYSEGLIKEFQSQGYAEGNGSNATLFTFPYDWRYGVTGIIDGTNSTAVDLLQQKIQEIRQQTGSDKVDVVVHSTGGLLLKKYVIDHPTDNHIGKAVFVGVPNTGAPKAVKVLLEGDNFGIPWLADSEMQKISQNLPIVYDLSPSQKYFDTKGSYVKIINQDIFHTSSQDLDFNQASTFLTSDHNANAQALLNSHNLHTSDFDNFDMRTAGVDLYAIDGCKTGTISKIVERRTKNIFGDTTITYDQPQESPGDGTVPLESATNLPIDQSNKYYALKADHGKMPSQAGIRQQIVNIISGSSLAVSSGDITKDATKCKLKGKAISVYSPLDISITDQYGNHAGLVAGGIQNEIPNADFEIMDDHKFIYLPSDEDQIYTINLKGTGEGTFTLKDQDIDDNQVTQTEVFSNLPVTPALTGQVNLGNGNEPTTLTLLAAPSSTPVVVIPSSIINAAESEDLTPPVSTSTIFGAMGEAGFYRSNVNITLAAADPVINQDPSQTSGILSIKYKLDNQGYQNYSTSALITVTAEGRHSLNFFSTDRAGNNEQEQTINFVIDKTPPEFVIRFNPALKDIQFTGSDNFSAASAVVVLDLDNVIILKDQAGNTTQITLKNRNRKETMSAELQALFYNNQPVDVSNLSFKFAWSYDQLLQLKTLQQYVKSKTGFNIAAFYKPNSTQLSGKDATGKISQILNGLVLLKITTNQGDFTWGY